MTLDPDTVSVLKTWRRRQREEGFEWESAWTDTGLVFTREDGTAWRPERITRVFAALVKKTKYHPSRCMASGTRTPRWRWPRAFIPRWYQNVLGIPRLAPIGGTSSTSERPTVVPGSHTQGLRFFCRKTSASSPRIVVDQRGAASRPADERQRDMRGEAQNSENVATLYTHVIESCPDAALLVRLSGEVIVANERAARLHGLSHPDELVGRQGLDFVVEEERRVVAEKFQRAAAEDTHNDSHFDLKRPDGTIRKIEMSVAAVRNQEHPPEFFHLIMRDVTEARDAEQELLKFKLGIERSGEGIFMTDVEGHILYANPAFEAMFGFSREEWYGKTPRILKSGVLPPEIYERFWSTILSGEVTAGELINKTKDGRLLNIQGSANPILDEHGELLGFLAIQRNITAQKQAEERLVLQERMASLGRLTAGIAHEMNTPLAAVRSSLLTLRELSGELRDSAGRPEVTASDYEEIAREMLECAQLAETAAERAAAFVRTVKSRTRDLGPQTGLLFDPVPVVRDALLLLHHDLTHHDCRVEVKEPEEKLEIQGSPVRFAEVITNLVENALYASAPTGGLIQIVFALTDQRRLGITVSDQGCGMPPEVLAHVFEPMFSTKPFGEGTGLGLSIVHDVVTGDFGGTITVQSAPGEGTTFRLELPLRGVEQ
ncbi:MAG: PAS domain S-box protein [Actinobacteria bacterium]|nr:PAS domain S-box protein [Actinomycetota bacterium]